MKGFALLALVGTLAVSAVAEATPVNVALDIQGAGLDYDYDAVGLRELGGGTTNFDVTLPSSAAAALLWWAGRDRPCPESGGSCVVPSQPWRDQQLRFAGNTVTGTIIGTEQQPATPAGKVNNIGFLADVTGIVNGLGTGDKSYTLADADNDKDLDVLSGAVLIVIFSRPGDSASQR